MVADSVMTAMIFTAIMSGAAIVVPFAVIYFKTRRKETGILSSFGLGLLAYFWSQYLLPIPVLFLLTNMGWFMKVYETDNLYVVYLLITALLLASLASLGRVWCIWLMNRKVPSLYRAMSSAVGFASFKAVSVLATYLSYYNYMKIFNAQGRNELMKVLTASGTVNNEKASSMIDNLTQAGAFDAAMQGINVVMALLIETALIIIIYEGYIRKKTVLATVISGAVGFAYSFLGMLINALGTDKMGNVLDGKSCALIYDAYVFACALAAVWVIYNSYNRYKRVLAEGPYAHFAYFEKTDKKKSEKEKMEQLL